jgi:hypothetical protein
MKFDVYAHWTTETKSEDNVTVNEVSTRKKFKSIELEEAKTKVNDFFSTLPSDATSFYVEVHKSYEERMEDALNSI